MNVFDLSEAIDNNPMFPGQQGDGGWPAQPGGTNNPAWPSPSSQPGQPGGTNNHPAWPSPSAQPTWPSPSSQPGQPAQPTWPSPSSQPSQPSAPFGPSGPAPPQTFKNLTVPYQESLPHGVYENLLITIAGTIKPNANKITVDLSTDHDLAFHLNPRFNENGRQVIVRNSRIGSQWGKEERDLGSFPFRHGSPFEIKILCTSREFRVAVNNSHLLEYKHRVTNLRSINRLNIHSDLTLTKVNVEKV